MRRHPLTNAIQYDAIYPWSHATNPFCTCPRCHEVRKAKILNKCDVLEAGIDMLEWPNGQPAFVSTAISSGNTVVTRKAAR